MENKIELLKRIVNRLEGENNESLKLSLSNVHARGMFSLVVDGTEFGKLTRVFISDYKLNPFDVQLHTHRYPIRLTTISGNINHHIAKIYDSRVSITHNGITSKISTISDNKHGNVELSKFEYKSALNGGFGLKYMGETYVTCSDYMIPPMSTINLGINDYHTMSCSKDSIWIVEELGYETDISYVLGKPFGVNTLYNKPFEFEIESKSKLVLDKLREIIKGYETISF